jgi:hypothetical protein
MPLIEFCYRTEQINLLSKRFRNAKRETGNELSYELKRIFGVTIGLSHKSQHVN